MKAFTMKYAYPVDLLEIKQNRLVEKTLIFSKNLSILSIRYFSNSLESDINKEIGS